MRFPTCVVSKLTPEPVHTIPEFPVPSLVSSPCPSTLFEGLALNVPFSVCPRSGPGADLTNQRSSCAHVVRPGLGDSPLPRTAAPVAQRIQNLFTTRRRRYHRGDFPPDRHHRQVLRGVWRGDGIENCTTYCLLKKWSGVWIDGSADCFQGIQRNLGFLIAEGRLLAKHSFITAENIESLFTELTVPAEFDFLSMTSIATITGSGRPSPTTARGW